jgi:hypothetical protein
MTVPAWLLDTFAAIMLLVAAVSAVRLAAGRRDPDADIDGSHLLMGVAMAGTLTASLSTLPSAAWEVIFGLLTAWFGYRLVREYRAGQGLRALVREHHAPHLLHSAAMLYMFLALRPPSHGTSSGAMAGMGTAGLRLPTLALLFAFLLVAYVVADLDRVPPPRALAVPARLGLPTPAPVLATAGAPSATKVPQATIITATPEVPAAAPASDRPARRLFAPGVARGCRIAMGVTMAFMLIIMI